MLKRILKVAISFLVHVADRSFGEFFGVQRVRGVILYYHGVSEVEAPAFARQIRSLIKKARPVDLLSSLGIAANNYVAITFDDGFVSVVQNALPILREQRVPATIFVPTGSLGRPPQWVKPTSSVARNEIVMSPEQLRELSSDPLVRLGAHSVNHPRISELSAAEAQHEMVSSKTTLEEIIGKPVELFSFPHGAYSPRDLVLAKKAGYLAAFGIDPSLASPDGAEYLIGRCAVDPGDWPIEFHLKLSGAYRWLARLR